MHLPDGIVPVQIALAGYGASAGIAAIALGRLRRSPDPRAEVPRAAMLTAVFFAGSLVAIPLPPSSVHLMLTGLMGVMLGWFAPLAILLGLFLQAVLFGHGGLTTLGLNGVILSIPALFAFGTWRLLGGRWPDLAALMAGGGAVLVALGLFAATVLLGLPVALSASAERIALWAFMLSHLPLVVAEGFIVLVVVQVLRRVQPGLVPHG